MWINILLKIFPKKKLQPPCSCFREAAVGFGPRATVKVEKADSFLNDPFTKTAMNNFVTTQPNISAREFGSLPKLESELV